MEAEIPCADSYGIIFAVSETSVAEGQSVQPQCELPSAISHLGRDAQPSLSRERGKQVHLKGSGAGRLVVKKTCRVDRRGRQSMSRTGGLQDGRIAKGSARPQCHPTIPAPCLPVSSRA